MRLLRWKNLLYVPCLAVILWGSAAQTVSVVLADPLPQSELDALNEYPNWVGTTGSGQCTTSTTTTTTSSSGDVTINNQAAQQAAQQASTGGTNVGYALYDSTGKLLAHYNDTFENYGASITKAMILVAYLNQVGSGTLDSAQTTAVTGMIEDSSDPDADAVLGYLKNPASQIQAVAQQAGMTGFKYNDTGDSVYYIGQSQITANDFAKFFAKIDTMFPASQKSFALTLLSSISDQVGLLQAGLPGTVYSKEGWKPEPGTVQDSARSGSPDPFGMEGAPYIVNQAAQFSAGGTTYGVAVTVAGTAEANRTAGEAIIKNVVSALIQSGGSGQSSASPAVGSTAVSLPASATEDQKIAQTFIVGFDASTPQSTIQDIVSKYHIGGIYLTGTTDAAGAGFTKQFFDNLNSAAGTPLIIASDEEGGNVHRFSYPNISGGFPSAKQMGSMSDSQVQQLGQEVGQQMATDGVTTDLAPVLDLDDGTNIISQADRSFSSDPDTVADKAGAFAQGLESAGISPVFKHFPGFGGAGSGDTDTTAVTTPSTYNLQQNVIPYQKLLNQGSNDAVMLSNLFITNLTNGKPASISPETVNYLRNTLNFQGPITTDDLSALSTPGYGSKAVPLPAAVTDALQAGVDMPLFGLGTSEATDESTVQSIIDAVKGTVSDQTISAADSQVLALKSGSAGSGSSASTAAGGCCSGSGSETVPAGTLPSFIPEPYNGAFTEGGTQNNVSPSLLAAIFSTENNVGNSNEGAGDGPDTSTLAADWASFVKNHPDPNSGWPSNGGAGAEGPFQFLPSTWSEYAPPGGDINNLVDAAEAAGKLFASSGATAGASLSTLQTAIYGYNHSDSYVSIVLDYYNYYSGQPGSTPSGSTTIPASSDCVGTAAVCNSSSAPTGLSEVRQQIICIAQQQLALWKSQPGYPYNNGGNFAYANNGFLDYSNGYYEEWCADFASWVYNQAGDPFSGGRDGWDLPGVAEIYSLAQSSQGQPNSKFSWHPTGGYTPQPGDLAIFYNPASTNPYVHVSIYISPTGGPSGGPLYIAGDAGSAPDGVYGGSGTTTPPNPPSESIVATESEIGPGALIGYVSPD